MQTENDTALAEFPARLARVTKEGLMVLFIGVSLFLLLALMGYDARDPGWSHLAYQPNVSNFTGVVGAWVADLFFATLGYAAYLVPFVVAIASFGLLKNRQMSLSDSIPFFILRTMGVLVVLAAFSGLAATHLGTAVQTFPFSAGGLVGEVISDYSVGYLHYVGASVVLTFLALFGLTLYIRQSWLSLLERLGLQTEKLTTQLFDTSSKAIVGRKAKSAVEVPEHDDFYERGEPALGELTPEAGAEQPTQAVAAPVSAPDPLLSQEALLAARIGENSHTKTEKVEQAHSPTSDYIRRPVENNVPSSPNVPNSPVAPSVEEAPVLRPEPVEQKTLSSEKSQTLTSNAAQSVEDTQKQQEQEVNQAFKGAAPDSVNTQSRVVDKEKSNTLDSASHNSVVVTDKVDEALPVSAVTSAATEPAPEKKGVKIVPLAEAHKPMKDRDLGLDGKQVPAVTKEKVQLPSLDLLDPPSLNSSAGYSSQELEDMSRLLEAKLKDFNVIAEVVEVNPGPVITRFEIQPAPGVKASKITNLAQDLARSMAVSSVRVVEVIPGKSVVGIEIPNEERQTVSLSEVLNSKPYLEAASKLTLGLGNDIAGNPVVANLAKMPHLLVAGTTGSGKSVGVNAML
ncbi:MAG: DNA translocase FtsK 4TM domain-containing protein, partial [Pontibacterium sp.]